MAWSGELSLLVEQGKGVVLVSVGSVGSIVIGCLVLLLWMTGFSSFVEQKRV